MFTKSFVAKWMVLIFSLFLLISCGGGTTTTSSDNSTPVQPPTAPSLTAGDTQIQASWSIVSGATAYEVWHYTSNNSNLASKFSDVTIPSATITPLTNGTTYYVWVKAKNTDGTSGFSPSSSATPQATTGLPTITSFNATPAAITVGGSSMLAFTFTGGTGSIDSGVGAVTSGTNVNVSPSATTTYTLTVTPTAGTSVTTTATVNVIAAGGGTATFVNGRIEYDGTITIDEVCTQLGNAAYLQKEGANKYTFHVNAFGRKNSVLNLSNAEVVFDGSLNILAHGMIVMNDTVLYTINGTGLVRCYRGESGIDPSRFGLFANNLRWRETMLESDGNSNSFYYKSVITNSSMEGYTFPTSQNSSTPYWPSYISTLRIDYSLNSELRNLVFKDFIFTLPADTFGSYNAVISLGSSEGVIIDSVTFDNINMNMRDNSGGSLIGKWSSSIQVRNVTGARLNLGNGLGEHETSGASYTYSDISLEGINIPPSNLLTVGWNRYNHSGNIEKLTHATFKNFITGIQSNTGGGIDVNDFLISDVITGASLGVVWSHSLFYGSPFGSRTLKHGRIQNAETGYDLRGTATSTGYGEPIPEAWGLSTVYSEDVIINASNRALSSGGYDSGHRFYGLNDAYHGGNYDIYINRDDFQLFLINCAFIPAKTYISGSGSFIKNYQYLDVKVVDVNNNPISGASVVVTNNTDPAYPSININGITKSSFVTGADGHTPLPSDAANSAAILAFYKTATPPQEMSYAITASYGGKSASTTVVPDATWYRADPAVPASSGTVVLKIN